MNLCMGQNEYLRCVLQWEGPLLIEDKPRMLLFICLSLCCCHYILWGHQHHNADTSIPKPNNCWYNWWPKGKPKGHANTGTLPDFDKQLQNTSDATGHFWKQPTLIQTSYLQNWRVFNVYFQLLFFISKVSLCFKPTIQILILKVRSMPSDVCRGSFLKRDFYCPLRVHCH